MPISYESAYPGVLHAMRALDGVLKRIGRVIERILMSAFDPKQALLG